MGQVWAESEGPGKGSAFVVKLPVAQDQGKPVEIIKDKPVA